MPTLDIIIPRTTGFVAMHVAGFVMYRSALRRVLGLTTRTWVYRTPETMAGLLRDSGADIVMLVAEHTASRDELRQAIQAAREANPARRIVFFDTFDATSTPLFSLLPFVDLYVKSKCLRPVEGYTRPYAGDFIFTEYCASVMGWDLHGWSFGSVASERHLRKIVPGWSYGASRGLRWLARLNRLAPLAFSRRPIQLHARITAPARESKEWYERYRAFAAETVDRLRGRFVTTPVSRVSRRAYLLEMRRCKLVFSPFGWGELCLRDYEAVCSGCLLIKPDMSHLTTSPDVFEPLRTYVPIKWDLSDLEEACDRYLTNEREAASIAKEAQRRMHAYFERHGFVEDVAKMLRALEERALDATGTSA
ncbi:MAG: glycosyltransferase [Phycisphaerae bacterium]